MPPPARQKPPTFRWTGLMILLPVLALGAVGLWQLRQDRSAALAEAQDEAKTVLEEVLRLVKTIPQTDQKSALFSLTGARIWPKPIPLIPRPNSQVNPHDKRLTEIISDPKLTSSEQAYALHKLASVEDSGTTSAGLPVKHLALRNALRFGKEARMESVILQKWATTLATAVTENPTLLSEKLLLEASVLHPFKADTWDRAQTTRKLLHQHASKIDSLITQNATLATWLDSKTFCQIRSGPGEISLTFLTFEKLQKRAKELLKTISLPSHLALRLSLDERLLNGDPNAELLSSTTKSNFHAEVVFTDRAAFFQPVTQRSVRTAWLIALAVLAAGIGWFAAWWAFLKQQQLAAMKDNFVSAVSHELKAPIAAIGLMAEELGAGSKKRTDYSRLIAGECARLGSLVENVLDYARLESGKNEFHFEEADLGELVRATADLMRPPAAERGIEIKVIAPKDGQLCATIDARALGRAVVNLLDNAIKYAPPKKTITLAAAENQITVSDQGPPIPASERHKIFDRFYRSGSELTRETKGVGIGLSLVNHVAQAHGGEIKLESDESGNHFILSFTHQCPPK